MVFRRIWKTEETLETERVSSSSSPSLMATAPVKSQPLHNFSLPHLKWGKNQTSNQRCRKHTESSRDSPSIDHHQNRSSASEAESDGGCSQKDQDTVNQKSVSGSRTVKNRFQVSSCSSGSFMVKTESGVDEVRSASSNLVIRFPKGKSKDESASKNKSAAGGGVSGADGEGGGEGGETEEPVAKPWNLRPRRSAVKVNVEHNGVKNGEMEDKHEIQPKSLRLRGLADGENVEKKEKLRFSISLTREEIEEDFFVWTDSKPPRRPKKRNRTVQKLLDNTFPGLWLAGVTADCYNVPEVPPKK